MIEGVPKNEFKSAYAHRKSFTELLAEIFGTMSSARDAETYRSELFPEMQSVDALLNYLRGKCIVDIGSGLTHKYPKALINRVASELGEDTLFIGIDPNVGGVKGKKLFDQMSRLLESMIDSHNRRENGPQRGPAGEKFGIQGTMPGTVLPEKGVDIFISNWLLGYWIQDPRILLVIFTEIESALTEDGEVRIGRAHASLFLKDDELGSFIDRYFTIQQESRHAPIIFRRKKEGNE